jgi:hypothetical protein
MVCYGEPVVGYHDVLCCASGWVLIMVSLCWANGCESFCVMLSQWLWIMVCYVESWDSWCAMLSHWFWIMVCYAEPVVVHHGVLFWTSDCESRYVILSPVVVNHVVLYTVPVVVNQCVILNNWLWFMVSYAGPVVVNHMCYAEPVVMNYSLFWWASCESWWVMLR